MLKQKISSQDTTQSPHLVCIWVSFSFGSLFLLALHPLPSSFCHSHKYDFDLISQSFCPKGRKTQLRERGMLEGSSLYPNRSPPKRFVSSSASAFRSENPTITLRRSLPMTCRFHWIRNLRDLPSRVHLAAFDPWNRRSRRYGSERDGIKRG